MSGAVGVFLKSADKEEKWQEIFDKLNEDAFAEQDKFNLTMNVAQLPQNLRLNRYYIFPYDHALVELADGTYINASHLHTKDAGRCYILTQGPLPHTAIHFWRMVWEQNVHCILMLNRLIESGSRKCCSYFPGQEIGSKVKSAGPLIALQEFRIRLLEEIHKPNYTIRSIELNNIKLNLSRNIRHYQYVTWPDFGVPNKTAEFLEFLFDDSAVSLGMLIDCNMLRNPGSVASKVRKNNLLNCAVNGPLVCHCAAGVGRTGTFVLADTAIVIAQKISDRSKLDLIKMILQYRRVRAGLIQTPEQLRFAFSTVIDALEDPKWTALIATTCVDKSTPLLDNLDNVLSPPCGPLKKDGIKKAETKLLSAREPEKSDRSESSVESKPGQLHDLPMIEKSNPTKRIDKVAIEKLNVTATPLTDAQSEPVKAFPRPSAHVAVDDKSSRSDSSRSSARAPTPLNRPSAANQKKNASNDKSSSEKSTSSSNDVRHKMAGFLTKTLSKISGAVGPKKTGGANVIVKAKEASKKQCFKKIIKKAKN